MNNRSMLTILALGAAISAQAGITSINGMKIYPRVFNDIPTSTFTADASQYPYKVEMQDVNVITGGWANRHIARFSADGGANPFIHPGGYDPFEIMLDATVTSSVPASQPRLVEAGFMLNIPMQEGWVSDVQMILTNDGEVAAFGSPIPFYSFTANGKSYTLGSKVKIGCRYFRDTDNRYKFQWHFDGMWSPKLVLEGTLNGLNHDFTTEGFYNYVYNSENKDTMLGFYLQVPKPNPDAKLTLENLQVDPYPAVKGTVLLGNVPETFREPLAIEVRNPGTETAVQTTTAYIQANGHYAFLPTVTGTYDIAIKGATHLRKVVPNVTITATGAENVDASLINGDVDNDNVVSVFDYIQLSDAFDSVPGDPTWNAAADLDRDKVISVFDYIILSDNFDQSGQD